MQLANGTNENSCPLSSGRGLREGAELSGGAEGTEAARRQQRHLLVQKHARRRQEERDEDEGAAGTTAKNKSIDLFHNLSLSQCNLSFYDL